MKSPIDLGQVTRRSSIAVVTSLLAVPCAFAQSQIDPEVTDDGLHRGFTRSTGKPGGLGIAGNQPPVQPDQPNPVPIDWRTHLLQGARSLVVLDAGREREIRYVKADNTLDADGYVELCWMLRDRQENRGVHMSIATLDQVCGVQRWAAHHRKRTVVQFTSGYRSPRTNMRTEGASKDSLHLQGRAIDGNFLGLTPVLQGSMAKDFNKDGGVGIYVDRSFVHMDDGRPRVWTGAPKVLRR
ncbi:MAG: DUF882 domain-containing protein [Polaromonas sp.]|nr:DUF882 domain-containing protein [Polaromonas sp.]